MRRKLPKIKKALGESKKVIEEAVKEVKAALKACELDQDYHKEVAERKTALADDL